ncbi:45153_t:CDS:2, partial [Gigaspora margarita]
MLLNHPFQQLIILLNRLQLMISLQKKEKRPIRTNNEDDEVVESSTTRAKNSTKFKKGKRSIQMNNDNDNCSSSNDNISEILQEENEDILTMLQDQDMQNEDNEPSTSSLLEDDYNHSEGFLLDNQEIEQIPSHQVLAVCNWLIKYPHVLKLASQMYIASSIPLANVSEFGESSTSWSVNFANSGDNKKGIKKYLIVDLKIILTYLIYREGTTTSSLTNEEIKNYITEKVVNDLLRHYISGTNQSELQKCGSLGKLITFIREMFRIHWRGKNIAQVKNLDNITKNMHIPSR